MVKREREEATRGRTLGKKRGRRGKDEKRREAEIEHTLNAETNSREHDGVQVTQVRLQLVVLPRGAWMLVEKHSYSDIPSPVFFRSFVGSFVSSRVALNRSFRSLSLCVSAMNHD